MAPSSPAFEPNPLSLSMSDEHVQRELWAATSASKKPAAQPPSGAATRRMRRRAPAPPRRPQISSAREGLRRATLARALTCALSLARAKGGGLCRS